MDHLGWHSGGVAPSKDQIARCLRELRQEASLTQRQLAERLGRSQRWAQDREAGKARVDPVELIRWCEACGHHPPDVLARLLREGGS